MDWQRPWLALLGWFGIKKSDGLVWCEIQHCPMEYRLFIATGESFLLGCRPSPAEPVKTWLCQVGENLPMQRRLLEGLAALITEHGLLEQPISLPQRCFADEAMEQPSWHLRVRFRSGRSWMSYYAGDSPPDAVRAFVDAATLLAEREIAAVSCWNEISPQASPEAANLLLAPHGKLKVTRRGQVYWNGTQVTLVELVQGLQQLKANQGVVWYYREEPERELSGDLETLVKFVMDAIIQERLPVRICPTDFE